MENQKSQGGLANSSGKTLESVVISTLFSKGFEVVTYKEYSSHPEKYGKEILIKNVPFKTIYKHDGKTEFLLKSEKHNICARIECKWQQSKGSVDEKFPYLYLNCIEKMPENEIWIIIDGRGAKEGSVDWLKQACRNKLYTDETNKDKDILVMDLLGFISIINRRTR